MPFISADWSIAVNGDIRYIGDGHVGPAPSYATGLELHRALQDFADDASAVGDDLLDITNTTPSDRSTDNIITLLPPYNIDDASAEHLYDGTIIQANGDTIYDGIVNFGNASFINVAQNGSLITNDFWNSLTPAGFNADSAQGISHRFMIKVRDGGVDIDSRRLLGLSREFGQSYSEFPINGTSRGNNVLALSSSADLNNQTAEATIAGYTDIVNNNEGYTPIDVDGDGNNEFYYSQWTRGSRTINDLYERIKWATRRGSGETLYGLPGELFRGPTHEIDIDNTTGTFVEPELVTWATGTGQLLAIDSPTGGTKLWIQLLTGVAPTDNTTLTGAGGATADVNVNIVERAPSIGGSAPLQSTGTAIIGPYGLGTAPGDLTASDSLTDLTNTPRTPPNNVQFVVNGVVSGEDRILVGPESGGALEVNQFTVNGALAAGATTITINVPIPSDTPTIGNVSTSSALRVFNGSTYDRISYSSYTGNTFTVDATDHPGGIPNAISNGANSFIGYIDVLANNVSESFTSVFLAPRPLFVRVRDGAASPIKTFETTATLGTAGGAVTVIRTSDA